jgi:type II secretory pathway pseudopilin PulG
MYNGTTTSTGDGPPTERDRGATFIEVLVSVVILGTAGVAVLTALAAAATGASAHRSVSESQSALATAGDAITTVDVAADTYQSCDGVIEYDPVVQAVAPTVRVSSVEFWTGTAWSTSDCRFSTDGERLQRITLETDGKGVTRSLAVIKRPATDPTVGVGPIPPSSGTGFGNVTIVMTPGVTG